MEGENARKAEGPWEANGTALRLVGIEAQPDAEVIVNAREVKRIACMGERIRAFVQTGRLVVLAERPA